MRVRLVVDAEIWLTKERYKHTRFCVRVTRNDAGAS